MSSSSPEASFSISTAANGRCLNLSGTWDIANLSHINSSLVSQPSAELTRWTIDGSKLEYIDTASAMSVLKFLDKHKIAETEVSFTNCTQKAYAIFSLVAESIPSKRVELRSVDEPLLNRLGRAGVELYRELDEILCFIGQIALAATELLHKPSLFRAKEVTNQIQTTGIDAVGIVCLVNFLIGIVIAYLSGVQLEQYGANIFIVDGISLGMTRELAPILAAIVVAGRSGSAFTAQLGTMKLNQEIDAAETMGLSAIKVLVLPRVLALMIVLPLLVFLGDIAGILGGLVAADLRLGVSATTFLDRLRVILPLQTVFVGVLKAPVFAFFIASIACHLGLTTEANARSVGEHTTKTVVRAIVAVILLNATFAVLFSELGI